MAISILFQAPGMTKAQYDRVVRGLDAAGHGKPKGRLYHVASPLEGGWQVLDVWESQETFDKFGTVLLPLLEKAGVKMPPPKITPVHNIIR